VLLNQFLSVGVIVGKVVLFSDIVPYNVGSRMTWAWMQTDSTRHWHLKATTTTVQWHYSDYSEKETLYQQLLTAQ